MKTKSKKKYTDMSLRFGSSDELERIRKAASVFDRSMNYFVVKAALRAADEALAAANGKRKPATATAAK